jgi:hypothetical protein
LVDYNPLSQNNTSKIILAILTILCYIDYIGGFMFTKINETQAITTIRYNIGGKVEYATVLVPSADGFTDHTKMIVLETLPMCLGPVDCNDKIVTDFIELYHKKVIVRFECGYYKEAV